MKKWKKIALVLVSVLTIAVTAFGVLSYIAIPRGKPHYNSIQEREMDIERQKQMIEKAIEERNKKNGGKE
jgi:CHASE3 domain sensor protein